MDESERELQQLVDALPQYENQIRYWESQLEAISNVRNDVYQAQETIEGMLDSKPGMELLVPCLLYTSPSPRDQRGSRMPSSA